MVTPGFIDGHTHMDAQVFWDELGTNSCWHGVTTVVMGHCGFTLAPALPDARELVVRNLERAEDIAPAALAAGIDWTWTSFAEYLDALDRIPKGINYAANIGHSALRTYVMGERAFEGEATDDDLAAMKAELSDALRAGAYGFTTSRTRASPDVRRPARCVTARVVGRSGPARRGARRPGRRQLPDRERPVATRAAPDKDARATATSSLDDRRPGRPSRR